MDRVAPERPLERIVEVSLLDQRRWNRRLLSKSRRRSEKIRYTAPMFFRRSPKRAPAPEPTWEERVEIARPLNRAKVSAAPLQRLPLVSIFDDEEYENYDFDLIAPLRRLRIGKELKALGFRQVSGSTFESKERAFQVVIPKPGILGSDPSKPADLQLQKGGAVVLVTPTQALLLYLYRLGPETYPETTEELAHLVWEQPANFEKVAQWARPAGLLGAFSQLRKNLQPYQTEGIDLRRRRKFQSRLPS